MKPVLDGLVIDSTASHRVPSRHNIHVAFVTNRNSNEYIRPCNGATENARPENDGLENDGQTFSNLPTKVQGLENAELVNDGPCFSKLQTKLRRLENVGPC